MEIGDFFSQGNGLQHLPAFLTSLAIGLLIGLERERSPAAKAGLRTFTLTALSGTLIAMLASQAQSPWLLAVGLLIVAAIIITAYLHGPEIGDPGTTTETALVFCFGLGAMVWYG
jgi:peptidoglycan/LPS O-acetylase OafA/YrhL